MGFQIVEESNATADGFLDLEDMPPFFKELFAKVDTNHDGDVSPGELAEALKNTDTRDQWAKLIAHHPTEWKYKADATKWSRLDKLLETSPKTLKHEKECISKYVFWEELTGKALISADAVWHFHPIGMIGGFLTKTVANSGQITYDAEGNDIPGSPYFSRCIHWPGNDLSGVTLGRGYDMGFRSETEIYNHMIAAGVEPGQATKISKARNLKGAAANNFVVQNKTDIGNITLEQQKALFALIYPDYVSKAIANYNRWTSTLPAHLEWAALRPIIQDILVDFVYQGFTKGENPMRAGMKDDVDELIRYIENTPAISQYEPGRKRAAYLKKNR
ncbi:calcium sensor EFh [Pseudomonas syringae group genomosp. 3]|nr:calcium sensor EFh [Pseudomonas syringae group genomosp. 3]